MKKRIFLIFMCLALGCLSGCGESDSRQTESSLRVDETESSEMTDRTESVDADTQTKLGEMTDQTEKDEFYNQNQPEEADLAEWSCSEIVADDEDCEFQVSAYDLYMDCGYGWYECKKSGNYQFERTGTLSDIYSEHSDDVVWKVFLLDEPFEDAPRFIAQSAEQELCGDGTVFVEEGRYIVVYCSQNVFGYGTDLDGQELEGDKEACYRCVYVEE